MQIPGPCKQPASLRLFVLHCHPNLRRVSMLSLTYWNSTIVIKLMAYFSGHRYRAQRRPEHDFWEVVISNLLVCGVAVLIPVIYRCRAQIQPARERQRTDLLKGWAISWCHVFKRTRDVLPFLGLLFDFVARIKRIFRVEAGKKRLQGQPRGSHTWRPTPRITLLPLAARSFR